MTPFIGEIIGTAILILLGNGVVANVLLKETKGNDSGWLVITVAWGVAVFVGVFTVAPASGAHLNPAVTLGLAVSGKFAWGLVPGYLLAQMVGAMAGAGLVYLHYRQHYAATDDPDLQLATFATAPAIRSNGDNLISEIIGTFLLVFAVLYIVGPTIGDQNASLGALDALPVALVVLGIGLSLGGTTGYAINPARDLGPRLMHALLPIPRKGSSDWGYAWIPVVGPLIGGGLAGLAFLFFA
jgi:glycerol uptake facilitator protein